MNDEELVELVKSLDAETREILGDALLAAREMWSDLNLLDFARGYLVRLMAESAVYFEDEPEYLFSAS